MEPQGHIADEKKSIVESIKEKLPGGHAEELQGDAGVTGTEMHDIGEKKGVAENIKEKLPGGHDDPQHTTGTTGSETHATTATSDGNYGPDDTGEKKSMMDKIKDKLPGQH